MSWRGDSYDQDDSDREEEDFINHATVVIIDNSEKMFEVISEDDEEYCAFQTCLQALYDALDRYVFYSWNSKLCIQFLDGREHGVFHNLSKDIIGIMKKLLEVKGKPPDELKTIYCSSNIDNTVLYEAFQDACDSLRKNTQENDTKNIVMLTNEPECGTCNIEDDDLERVIETITANKIDLIVVPLVSNFDWTKFYGKLLNKTMDNFSIDDLTDEGYEDSDSLAEVLDTFVQPKRNVQNVAFYFGPPTSTEFLLLQVRKGFKPKKLFHNAKVDPKTMRQCVRPNKPQDLPSCSTQLDEPTLNLEEKSENITISAELEGIDASEWAEDFDDPMDSISSTKMRDYKELFKDASFKKALRTLDNPGTLRLLYVSDKRTSAHYVNKPAFYIEPNQVKYDKNQVEIFQYFWDHCYEENKVLICTYVGNLRQKYIMVQLEPQSLNDHNYFMAQYLSYFDGIKPAVKEKLVRNQKFSGENLDVMSELIQKLTISDTNRPFEITSQSFESKAALIKGVLLSTKQTAWEPPERHINWPTQEQIEGKLGKDLLRQLHATYFHSVYKRKK